MQFIIDGIRKIVVLVLLMELVIQMQSGKQYESYIKMLVGVMVVYSIVSGICGVFEGITSFQMAPMQEFVWSGEWDIGTGNVVMGEDKVDMNGTDEITSRMEDVQIEHIVTEEIKIKEIKLTGGMP